MTTDIRIAATDMSPEVSFQFSEHRFSLSGESYPENATAFYGPLIVAVEEYLSEAGGSQIEIEVRLAYFNSASTKMLFNLFDRFNEFAALGNTVVLHWIYDEEDDTILEFGNELASDFAALVFRPQAMVS